MLRLLPLAVFVIPAAWMVWLAGTVLREGLAALLYYRLADLTPWLIENHSGVAGTALVLAALANLLLLAEVEMHRVRIGGVAFLSVTGGILWMAAALVQPDWWLNLSNGLVVFTLANTPAMASLLTRTLLTDDELIWLLGKLILLLMVVGIVHAAVGAMLP